MLKIVDLRFQVIVFAKVSIESTSSMQQFRKRRDRSVACLADRNSQIAEDRHGWIRIYGGNAYTFRLSFKSEQCKRFRAELEPNYCEYSEYLF